MTLGDALRAAPSRNLDLLRLVLAMSVIVSHAWPLALGPDALEPLEALTGRSLGGWAVGGFFFVSGLLISASAARRRPAAFWAARLRRIVPGLSMALIVTLALAVAGGSTTDLRQGATWFLRALTLVSIEHRLPDAFATNPIPEVVNGPLWSLFHEVAAYVVCALFAWSGLARRPWPVAALLVIAALASLVDAALPARLAAFAPLFCAFAAGMAAYAWRDRIVVTDRRLWLGLPLLLLLPAPLAMGGVGFVLVLAALRAPAIAPAGDASFGLYIYGWPVAQAIVALQPGIAPTALAILSLSVTYPLALLSWHLVERPALAAPRATA